MESWPWAAHVWPGANGRAAGHTRPRCAPYTLHFFHASDARFKVSTGEVLELRLEVHLMMTWTPSTFARMTSRTLWKRSGRGKGDLPCAPQCRRRGVVLRPRFLARWTGRRLVGHSLPPVSGRRPVAAVVWATRRLAASTSAGLRRGGGGAVLAADADLARIGLACRGVNGQDIHLLNGGQGSAEYLPLLPVKAGDCEPDVARRRGPRAPP